MGKSCSIKLSVLVARYNCNSFSSSMVLSCGFILSQRISKGSESPCTTSVTKMTTKARNIMECLLGKAVPSSKTKGKASAAANDITPLVPVQATTNTFFHVLSGLSLTDKSSAVFFFFWKNVCEETPAKTQ